MANLAISVDIDRVLDNLRSLAEAVAVGRMTAETATQHVNNMIVPLNDRSRQAALLLFSRLITQYVAHAGAYTL